MPEALPPFLHFAPALVHRVWGADRLVAMYPDAALLGPPPYGEAWLLSDHPQHESIVHGGPCHGCSLRELTRQHRHDLLGPKTPLAQNGRFPLLLKILDCKEPLSVQVHPDDPTAATLQEPDGGKTEAWYILEAKPGSVVYVGLRPGIALDDFLDAAARGRVAHLLTEYPAPPASTFFLPAGMVHALGDGLLLAEIQQNSDITYRIDDWGRLGPDGKPRNLHLDKARRAIHGNAQLAPPPGPNTFADCPYFTAEIVHLHGTCALPPPGDRCRILLPITAEPCTITAQEHNACLLPFHPILIPASTDTVYLDGTGTLLSFTPGTIADH